MESTALLFSDVGIPGTIDGFVLARYVAANWPEIEIVIASGHVSPETGDLPKKAPFPTKPFNRRMIHDPLGRILPDDETPEPLKKAV